MLKSEVGESRRAPAESFLLAGARFRFGLLCRLFPESSQLAFSIINLPKIGDYRLFLGRLPELILGDFLAKMGNLSDFLS